ncbi:hypothetical protein MED121_24010 [Marinomonas sp. MED121]|nr:hypothetical protein MED121_24010 [Marinomonas sp. MED121]
MPPLLAGVQCLKGIEYWALSVIGKDFRKMKKTESKRYSGKFVRAVQKSGACDGGRFTLMCPI